jgi:predicted nucleic acid-binding protein
VIVLDASAAIEWLFQSPAGIKIDRRIFSRSETLHVPHLLEVEVAQVLRRYVRDKTITAQTGGKKHWKTSATCRSGTIRTIS